MKILLVLGCWGREQDGFVMCGGIINRIYDLTKGSERNVSIADYLDTNFKIFDKPIYNNVHTVLWNIQDKFSVKGDSVFKEKTFKQLEEFCILHRKCGLYLRLDLIEEDEK